MQSMLDYQNAPGKWEVGNPYAAWTYGEHEDSPLNQAFYTKIDTMETTLIPVVTNRKIKATEYPSLPDEALGVLLRFYNVETQLELIDAQHSQIVRLQQLVQELEKPMKAVQFSRA